MKKKIPIEWHKLLGKLLQDLLSPVNISVNPEAPIMSDSPRIDILLLKRQSTEWTTEQLELLPDGIRDTKATDILLEFKYTESLNAKAIQQTLSYDYLYKAHKQKDPKHVQSFILCAQKPQKSTLKKLGYRETSIAGVYQSQFILIRKVILLSLNELSNEPHNAYVRCFASHLQEKEKAFDLLENTGLLHSLAIPLKTFIGGLKGFWFTLRGDQMNIEITKEQIAEIGRTWGKHYWSDVSVEEKLSGITTKDRLKGMTPQDRLKGMTPQDRLTGMTPQEILSQFKPQELAECREYINKHMPNKET